MKQNSIYLEVRNWIYRNARPLDLARWQYHFENGSATEIIKALSAYQNEDGGFGNALEADAWNPKSSPIQTFRAVVLLREINFIEKEHPVILGILKYLDSGADFNGEYWLNTILSNNDYAHAPWWEFDSESKSHNKYNPSVGLAGFVLFFADPKSMLYHKCAKLAVEAIEYLNQENEIDMHLLTGYIALMEYCEQGGVTKLFLIQDMKKKLMLLVNENITKDTSVWATSYICKPSHFFLSPDSIFYCDNKEIAAYECEYIKTTRNCEGVWNITWGWAGYPEEWAISKNWWKSNVAIENMIYLRNF